MLNQSYLDHPENDLITDADFTNMMRPAPRDFDELADAPDPLVVAQANRRSTRQAILWAALTPVVTLLVAGFLAVVARMQGGEYCEAGTATWFCSRQSEIWWPFATSMIPIASMFGTAIMMAAVDGHVLVCHPLCHVVDDHDVPNGTGASLIGETYIIGLW